MPLILAADNLHALNPVVAQALHTLNPQPLQELARRGEQAGAHWLDINPGFLPPRRHDRMAFMVESVQQVTNLRLILDSPDARVLARGLAVCRQPPILNACTLEYEKLREISAPGRGTSDRPGAPAPKCPVFSRRLPGRENHPGPGAPGARPGRRA